MLNSTSTIFTMDIYKPYINQAASQTKLVNVGRLTAGIALVIAVLLAPLLGGIDQMFQYIQEYTGLVSPVFWPYSSWLILEKSNQQRCDLGCPQFNSNCINL